MHEKSKVYELIDLLNNYIDEYYPEVAEDYDEAEEEEYECYREGSRSEEWYNYYQGEYDCYQGEDDGEDD